MTTPKVENSGRRIVTIFIEARIASSLQPVEKVPSVSVTKTPSMPEAEKREKSTYLSSNIVS